MPLEEMNEFILKRIEIIKNDDIRENKFDLKDTSIRGKYNINRSLCRG